MVWPTTFIFGVIQPPLELWGIQIPADNTGFSSPKVFYNNISPWFQQSQWNSPAPVLKASHRFHSRGTYAVLVDSLHQWPVLAAWMSAYQAMCTPALKTQLPKCIHSKPSLGDNLQSKTTLLLIGINSTYSQISFLGFKSIMRPPHYYNHLSSDLMVILLSRYYCTYQSYQSQCRTTSLILMEVKVYGICRIHI